MKKIKKIKRGFSIGEVMLSAFILSVTLVMLVRAISNSIMYSLDSRNSIIASELAQEGAELVRNFRDNNWAAGKSSFDSTGFSHTSDENCIASYNSTKLNCNQGTSAFALKHNGRYYNQNSGDGTKFQRRIKVSLSGDEMTVYSIVTWNGGIPPRDVNKCNSGSKCVFAQSVLDDWRGTGT